MVNFSKIECCLSSEIYRVYDSADCYSLHCNFVVEGNTLIISVNGVKVGCVEYDGNLVKRLCDSMEYQIGYDVDYTTLGKKFIFDYCLEIGDLLEILSYI